MSGSQCKICENPKDLFPLRGDFLGHNLLKIINNVTQSNVSIAEIGKSVICNTCAGALYLVNTKVIEFKRVFLPQQSASAPSPLQQVQSAPKKIKSTKKKANINGIAEVVKEHKSSQIDGDITTFLKPKVNTKVPAKTKQLLETTKDVTNTKIRKDSQSDMQTNTASNIICCTDSEQDITEVDISRPSARTTTIAVNKPAPINKRRPTVYNFECEFANCGFQSGVVKAFQNHLTEIHNVLMPRIFECKQCQSRYVAKSGLDTHLKKCGIIPSAKEKTNKQDTNNDGSTNINGPPNNSTVTSATEENGQIDLVESDDGQVSVIYENSPLSSTKLKNKEVLEASKQNMTDEPKDEISATSMEFPVQMAKIRPVTKKSLTMNDKPSPLKKDPSVTKKRSLSLKRDTPPTKKKRSTLNGDALPAKKDISTTEDSSPTDDVLPTEATSPTKKKLLASKRNTSPTKKNVLPMDCSSPTEDTLPPQVVSPLKKAPSQSVKGTSLSKKENPLFQFICTHCKEIVVGAKEFKQHLIDDHNDVDNRIFACEYCPKKYLSFKSLTTHLDKYHITPNTTDNNKLHNNSNIQGVNNAAHESFHNQSLKKGKQDNSTITVLQCDEELEKTIDIAGFDTPKKRSQKTKVKDSDTPIKDTNRPADGSIKKKNLSVSFNIEDIEEPSMKEEPEIPCPKCLKCFKSTKKLERHINKTHGTANEDITDQKEMNVKNNVYHCENCGKAFSAKEYLLKHMKKKHNLE